MTSYSSSCAHRNKHFVTVASIVCVLFEWWHWSHTTPVLRLCVLIVYSLCMYVYVFVCMSLVLSAPGPALPAYLLTKLLACVVWIERAVTSCDLFHHSGSNSSVTGHSVMTFIPILWHNRHGKPTSPIQNWTSATSRTISFQTWRNIRLWQCTTTWPTQHPDQAMHNILTRHWHTDMAVLTCKIQHYRYLIYPPWYPRVLR